MWIIALLPLLVGVQCVDDVADSNQPSCGHNYQSNCLIVATFGNSALSEAIELLVNCTGDAPLNQYSRVERVEWDGCHAMRNLRFLGLRKIASRKDVKSLRVERFFAETIEAGTFEGFSQLQQLTIETCSISRLDSQAFNGLESLATLKMAGNGLTFMAPYTLQPLARLNTLQITDDASLLMASHQFDTTQIVDSVALEIYYAETDLVEHLLNHVRNLSIWRGSGGGERGCEQANFNGFEKGWPIESLRVENFRCGFAIEEVSSLTRLEISRAVTAPYNSDGLKLRNLRRLKMLSVTHNDIKEFSSHLDGDFGVLEELDLSFNALRLVNISLLADSFATLRQLNLSHNQITRLIDAEKSAIQIAIDANPLECEWLTKIAQSAFQRLVYARRFENLNIDGLECSLPPPPSITPLRWHSSGEHHVKRANLAFIVCGAILLGAAATYAALFAYNRRRLLKHQPFYHLLRDSLVRPFSNARDTLARDFKGIIFRNLPATNYEHPISATTTEMTEVIEEGNIYEEIPEKAGGG